MTGIAKTRPPSHPNFGFPLPERTRPHSIPHILQTRGSSGKELPETVKMSSRRRRRNSSAMPACIPALAAPSPCPSLANLLSPGKQRPSTATKKTDLEELKSTISSRIELLRKDVDHNYIGVIKEMEAASARLAKRTKLEVQTCLQQMDQISQEWQNFAADAHEDIQDAQGTCKELVSRIQCMGAQFSKIATTDVLGSAEKQLEALRVRYALS